jgi:hypothetical protein
MNGIDSDYVLGAVYLALSALAVWWQHKASPPESIRRLYSIRVRLLAWLPFYSLRRAGIATQHLSVYGEYRRRTWVFYVVFVGGLQAYIVYMWCRYG